MNFVPKEEVQPSKEQLSWLDRPLLPLLSSIKIETILITLILILAVFSRFYILGARVMSHDETNHVVPSWELYQGQGYVHDPITHGPLQFHLIALTFFLFGDSDFTARIPAALFSIATVAFAWWGFRRYFGRTGALVSSFLMLISPYMLFYGRYVRNEAFIALFGLVTLFAMLRYLETGQNRYIFLLTTVTILNFTAKETAYIYTAQALLFLGVLFLVRVSKKDWNNPSRMRPFMVALAAGIVLLVGAIGVHVMAQPTGAGTATAVAAPSTVATPPAAATGLPPSPIAAGLAVLGVISLIAAGYFLVTGLTWKSIRSERSFDLLILLGTLVLPLLTAFPVNLVGWNPQDYSNTGILHTSLFLIPMTLIAIGIGVWWRPRLWLQNAAIFYGIFTFFFTTFFTNGPGFFTGMVGSLGYWLAQQGVDRGSQPLYYYALIQIPMYEYLPAIGTLVAIYLAFRGRFPISVPEQPAVEAEPLAAEMVEVGDGVIGSNGHADGQDELVAEDAENPIDLEPPSEPQEVPFVALLLYWVFTALVAYSIAGEKMPWLTVHIALPMIIAAGWAFGHLIDTAPWKTWLQKRGLLALLLLPVFFFSLLGVLSSLLGTQPPFQGKDLVQLESTASFLIALIVLVASGAGLLRIRA
ncbi:MAG: TIGR03663 family protein [Chloroflexi bacterium]|nr:TIGR03663 family protein [Chloroflexota bacterium]